MEGDLDLGVFGREGRRRALAALGKRADHLGPDDVDGTVVSPHVLPPAAVGIRGEELRPELVPGSTTAMPADLVELGVPLICAHVRAQAELAVAVHHGAHAPVLNGARAALVTGTPRSPTATPSSRAHKEILLEEHYTVDIRVSIGKMRSGGWAWGSLLQDCPLCSPC